LRVAKQGYLAPQDHLWCRQLSCFSFCRSLYALPLLFPPKLSSHVRTTLSPQRSPHSCTRPVCSQMNWLLIWWYEHVLYEHACAMPLPSPSERALRHRATRPATLAWRNPPPSSLSASPSRRFAASPSEMEASPSELVPCARCARRTRPPPREREPAQARGQLSVWL
jgi:hypothetical protein